MEVDGQGASSIPTGHKVYKREGKFYQATAQPPRQLLPQGERCRWRWKSAFLPEMLKAKFTAHHEGGHKSMNDYHALKAFYFVKAKDD